MKILNLALVFLLLPGISGCSSDEKIEEAPLVQEPEEINPMEYYTPLTEKPVVKRQDFRGCGYDCTGYYVSSLSVRDAVFDMERYKRDNKDRVINSYKSSRGGFDMAGSTAWDYIKDLSGTFERKAFNVFDITIPDGVVYFGGTLLDNNTFYRGGENLDEYSFASTHTYYIMSSYNINDEVDRLSGYLTDSFARDVHSLSAAQLISKYGTHVIRHYRVGGRIDLIYQSKVKEKNADNRYDAMRIAEAGLRHTTNKIGFWTYSIVEPPADEEVLKNKVPVLYARTHGGVPATFASGTYNLQKGYPRLDSDDFYKSLTPENADLVEINCLTPLDEFISDSPKKQEVKAAIAEYVSQKQPDKPEGI